MPTVLPILVLLLASNLASAGDTWPQFRGPTGDGQADAVGLPITWSETENVVWKTPIHDLGWSSPVVWGDQVWVTTARKDGKQLFAVCVDRASTPATLNDWPTLRGDSTRSGASAASVSSGLRGVWRTELGGKLTAPVVAQNMVFTASVEQGRVFALTSEEDAAVAFVMEGVRPDVLVTDGKYIYLQQLKFDERLVRQDGLGRHLLAHSGLADDSWFYRTFWRLGYGDTHDFPNSYIKHDLRVPFGQLLVFNERRVCGLQTHFSPNIVPRLADQSGRGCLLFGDANSTFTPDVTTSPGSDYPAGAMKRRKTAVEHEWTVDLPFQGRAMVLAGQTLFVGGWADAADEETSGQAAAPAAGQVRGGLLWALHAETGRKLAEHELDGPPVFDGLIAAGGRLYWTDRAGCVACWGVVPQR